jgi:hypothetical protein
MPEQEAAKSSWRDKAREFLREHWKEVTGFILGEGATGADRWLEILPLPAELKFWGTLCAAILSVVAVLGAAILLRKTRVHWQVFSAMLACVILGLVILPLVFFWEEGRWKNPDTSFQLYYNVLEPFTYGLTFACLAGAVPLGLFLVADLFFKARESAAV